MDVYCGSHPTERALLHCMSCDVQLCAGCVSEGTQTNQGVMCQQCGEQTLQALRARAPQAAQLMAAKLPPWTFRESVTQGTGYLLSAVLLAAGAAGLWALSFVGGSLGGFILLIYLVLLTLAVIVLLPLRRIHRTGFLLVALLTLVFSLGVPIVGEYFCYAVGNPKATTEELKPTLMPVASGGFLIISVVSEREVPITAFGEYLEVRGKNIRQNRLSVRIVFGGMVTLMGVGWGLFWLFLPRRAESYIIGQQVEAVLRHSPEHGDN